MLVNMNDLSLPAKNFIYEIIDHDLKKRPERNLIATRFPPEPNGHLHIGHAKSICLNFGIAKYYQGTCNLRFDDTNPATEELEYVNEIIQVVKWLGFKCDKISYASDYFEELFEQATILIKRELAYVCDLTAEQIKEHRGTLQIPGQNSPYRDRSVEENLSLFQSMRDGKFADGTKVLRAKIDMSSANLNLRDPIMYRIRREPHLRTNHDWCIYPMYDYAQCLCDSLERITHSICTLEFENNRPLYNWFLDQLPHLAHPQQIEFARLNLAYTVLSKRKLLELINTKTINTWDDPRLPTLIGLKRRGYPPKAICNFCDRIGVTKQESTVELQYLEECVREELNLTAPRAMAVLDPLKIIITNFSELTKNETINLAAPLHPQDPTFGTRNLFFTKEIYIERDDFMEHPNKGFFRLSVGQEVRLKYAYIIKCHKVITNHEREIIELHCSCDPLTKGGNTIDGRKIKGTIHWVSLTHSIPAEVRLYEHLFTAAHPAADKNIDFKSTINPSSLITLPNCYLEHSLTNAKAGDRFQFERLGYFCVDHQATNEKLIFNRTVTLKDSWKKVSAT